MNIILEDMGFFVNALRDLDVSTCLKLSGGGLCVSTGTEAENWVYCPEGFMRDDAERAVNFFRERGESFLWPVLNNGGCEVLESVGLVRDEDLTGMRFDPENAKDMPVNEAVEIERAEGAESEGWVWTVWEGFGDEGGVPEKYSKFARGLCENRKFSAYTAKYQGVNAGTFLLTNEKGAVGVYYFAVRPVLRRKGIAAAMMREICRLSEGKKVVLLATAMGRKFYSAFGFEEIFRIPVYSTEADRKNENVFNGKEVNALSPSN